MNSISSKFVVSGKVQCVGFRFSTKRKAELFGLHGYAKNLRNGDVEVLAIGTESDILQLYDWLKVGPERAVVDKVIIIEEKSIQLNDNTEKFTIL